VLTDLISRLPELEASRARIAMRPWPTLYGKVGGRTVMDGRSVLLFGSNDYLGLASHPAVVGKALDALERYGVGTGMNPVLGVTDVHRELMEGMRAFTGCEDVLLFNSCTAANCALIATLVREGDVAISDELNHASIVDGCRLSGGRTKVYRHSDMGALEDALRDTADARLRLVITDGMFSMEGEPALLPDIARLADSARAIVAVDESHSAGVIGRTGRGTAELLGSMDAPPVQTGTFSKAFGAGIGGYVAGPRDLIDYLRDRARFFIFTSGMPAVAAAAALAALEVMRREPQRLAQLQSNVQRFRTGLLARGYELLGGVGPIVPILIGESERARALAAHLLGRGVYIPSMSHPIVPQGAARLRAQVSASHTFADIDETLMAFESVPAL
jgi:glycine C-acetyltransferase